MFYQEVFYAATQKTLPFEMRLSSLTCIFELADTSSHGLSSNILSERMHLSLCAI